MEKIHFGMFVIAVVAILQGIAWLTGRNGTIFAFTSLIIGAVTGAILGFTFNKITKE